MNEKTKSLREVGDRRAAPAPSAPRPRRAGYGARSGVLRPQGRAQTHLAPPAQPPAPWGGVVSSLTRHFRTLKHGQRKDHYISCLEHGQGRTTRPAPFLCRVDQAEGRRLEQEQARVSRSHCHCGRPPFSSGAAAWRVRVVAHSLVFFLFCLGPRCMYTSSFIITIEAQHLAAACRGASPPRRSSCASARLRPSSPPRASGTTTCGKEQEQQK